MRAVVLVAALLMPSLAEAGMSQGMFLRLSPSLVKVEAHNTDGSVSLGSGVVVAPGRVVTNCHVTRRAGRLQLVRGGARWPVEGQVVDAEHDLCLLIAPEVQSRVATIGDPSALRSGQTVIAAGFPGGLGARYSEGRVKALHDLDGSVVIQSTAQFDLGASGGGLFDDEGRLVGIITFKHRGRTGDAYHFSVPVDWVMREMLAERKLPQPVAPQGAGGTFWELPPAQQPLFLRAASLEARGDWSSLLTVAEAWAMQEGHHPEPWVALGKAQAALGEARRAIAAFRRATELDDRHAEAWYQLGMAYALQQDCTGLEEARRVLAHIDADLAQDLGRQTIAVQQPVSKEFSCA